MVNQDIPIIRAEFNRIKNFYKDFNPDDLNSLLNDLDEESVNIVHRAAKKIEYTLENYDKDISDLIEGSLTYDEIADAESKWSNFLNNITSVNSAYRYKDYFLPVHMFEYNVLIDRHCVNEINNLQKIEDKNIIDVGGFIGDSAIILSPLTSKKVYCFEVDSQNFKYIEETIRLNNLSNVVPINSALGEKPGMVFIDEQGSATTIAGNNDGSGSLCKQDSLDNFVKEQGNISVGLIKVDIEGYEMNFLRGAINTILEQKPVLILSIYHSWKDYVGIKKFIESLNLGYKFKIRASSIAKSISETVLICEV